MGKAIGIDLGTTNTAVAVLVDGRPRVLEDEKGYKVLPSCVSLKPSKNGEAGFVVGQAAKNLIVTRPDRTVYAVKRLMGRRFDSPEVQAIKRPSASHCCQSASSPTDKSAPAKAASCRKRRPSPTWPYSPVIFTRGNLKCPGTPVPIASA